MRSSAILTFLLSTSWYHLICALVSLQTIRDLTELTDECRGRIVGAKEEAVRFVGGQVVLGHEDGEEVEDTVTASLRLLCSDLLLTLEKPLDSSSSYISEAPSSAQTQDEEPCDQTTTEFHAFLGATVKFLYEVQERQMRWQWRAQSPVFDQVAWMQGLWASRKANSQHRSFIEQQMALYSATGCFGQSQEVLRRDVEVVEYLNDLIDSFA